MYGLVIGAIPGLTATMAVALLIPVTFFLNDLHAIAAIVTLEACAIFAGDIPAMLVRIPGTPSSAAYTDEAYQFTLRGEPERPLAVSLVFSVVGGLFGAALLMTAAPRLASIAVSFTSYEYFWLTVLGLSSAAIISRGSMAQGSVALLTGLLLSTIGLGAVHSTPRFTFGRDELIAGVSFIPAMIGLFGLSEVLRNVIRIRHAPSGNGNERSRDQSSRPRPPGPTAYRSALTLLWRRKWHVFRSSTLGSVIGLLPGAGADIAAWISLAVSKRLSRTRPDGPASALDGIGDATNANNSALAGAWIPTLVFGIPGDSVTAILIGVLLIKNITPGPEIFVNEAQSVLVYGIYVTFVLANLMLITLGWLAIRFGVYLVRIRKQILMPAILLFCVVGAYAINASYFDVWVMLAMGLLGFAFEAGRIPLGPVVLGIILGGKLEETFVQSLTKSSSMIDFFTRPVSAVLGALTVLLWVGPPIVSAWRRRDITVS